MFTQAQNNHLAKIMVEKPRSIRDLALLSLASRQNHPKVLEWRCVAPKTLRFPSNFLDVSVEPRSILQSMPFFVQPVEPPESFLWHVGDCYYIGMGDGPGLCTTSLRALLKVAHDVEAVCTDCLGQVARVLHHLSDKDIRYVHGNLTIDSVVRSLDGRFYIVDEGIRKQASSVSNPFACYTSMTHDMSTLCQSMCDFVSPQTYVGRLLDSAETSYDSLLQRLGDHLKVFKSNIQKDT